MKEPSLAPYRALAQRLEEKFSTFEVTHALRSENRYADARATLGSQVAFEGPTADVAINKRSIPITDLLKEEYEEQHLDQEDWRTLLKSKLMSPEGVVDLKVLKDFVLISGDLYRRLPEGILARCVSLQEGTRKLRIRGWGKSLSQTPTLGLFFARYELGSGRPAKTLPNLSTPTRK